jgi:hypothetical protein
MGAVMKLSLGRFVHLTYLRRRDREQRTHRWISRASLITFGVVEHWTVLPSFHEAIFDLLISKLHI